MVRIAVIDDGIYGKELINNVIVEDYVTFEARDYDKTGYTDVYIKHGCSYHEDERLSHGTKVINTILKYSKNTIISFCVFDVYAGHEHASGALIVEAVKMAVDQKVDMIVGCLTCDPVYRKDFDWLKEEVCQRRILFLAAASNDEKGDFPADLEYVLGVTGELPDAFGSYNYYHNQKLQFIANTQYEFVGNREHPQRFNGTSKATAMVAGRLAQLLDQNGIEWVQLYLEEDHEEIEVRMPQLLEKFAGCVGIPQSYCLKRLDKAIPWNQESIKMIVKFLAQIGRADDIYCMTAKDMLSIRNILQFCSNQEKGNCNDR